jgi:hypothetical protein
MNTIKLSEIDKALEIASNDQGHYQTPGGSIRYKEVTFFLMANGDYRARIDTRWGSNQGYFQENGGEIERINGETLDTVIDEATAYCESMEADNEGLARACRLAANEARQWERKHEIVSEDHNPLADFSTEALEAELQRRKVTA